MEDRLNYAKWRAKGTVAIFHPSLSGAGHAYMHYMIGSGTTRKIDLGSYFKNDNSGKISLENAIALAQKSIEELNLPVGKSFISSCLFDAGGNDNALFPYPETENWQKTIGAYKMWMTAEVDVKLNKDGSKDYKMKLTINMEDMYNFNPGQKDIATSTPDDENGRFEVVGFAKQYLNTGSHFIKRSWNAQVDPTTKKTVINNTTR